MNSSLFQVCYVLVLIMCIISSCYCRSQVSELSHFHFKHFRCETLAYLEVVIRGMQACDTLIFVRTEHEKAGHIQNDVSR
jgi:hypothetical protein